MKNKTMMIMTGLVVGLMLSACNPTTPQTERDRVEAKQSMKEAADSFKDAAHKSNEAVQDSATAVSTKIAEATGEATVTAADAANNISEKAVEVKDDIANSEYSEKVKNAYEQGKLQEEREQRQEQQPE